MGVDLRVEPAFFIMRKTPEDVDSKNQIYLLRVLLLMARKIITVLWSYEKSLTAHNNGGKAIKFLFDGKRKSQTPTKD